MEQELTARIVGLGEQVAAALRRIERLEKGQTALNQLLKKGHGQRTRKR